MDDSSKSKGQGSARPDAILNSSGVELWQAYNAMESTKRRHFDLLEVLDNKKKNYNLSPSEQDKTLLANLLKDHDEQVKRFTQASMALKRRDADAHMSLFAYISIISDASNHPQVQH